MRWCLIIICFLASAGVHSESYLIIDAIKTPETARQPTWIALSKGGKYTHIRTKQALVPIEPGHYFVSHIHFGESTRSAVDRVDLETEGDIRFEVEPESVTYVGMIQFAWDGSYNRHGSKYRITVLPISAMLQWACSDGTGAVQRLPVRLYESGKMAREVKVRCET